MAQDHDNVFSHDKSAGLEFFIVWMTLGARCSNIQYTHKMAKPNICLLSANGIFSNGLHLPEYWRLP